jgi:hypothetical protein
MDPSLVGATGNSSAVSSKSPIKILYGDGRTVTFEIHEYWKDGDNDRIASQYQDGDSSNTLDCIDVKDDNWDDVQEYTADCVDGFATVTLWVQEPATIQVSGDDPELCVPDVEQYWKNTMLNFSLPCSSLCIPKDTLTKTPTESPTMRQTRKPSASPTRIPTVGPTEGPTGRPTEGPTFRPTEEPTSIPTSSPTTKPTKGPTSKPTSSPTARPTAKPTEGPTARPTEGPTAGPTSRPTSKPTDSPTENPTSRPTETICVDVFMDPVLLNESDGSGGGNPPIKILYGDGSTVTFEVHEYWTDSNDGTSWIASHYDKNDGTNIVDCVDAEAETWDDVHEYTAECMNGFATITLWIQEAVSQEVTDAIPDFCPPGVEQEWIHTMYNYSLPCSAICVPVDSEIENTVGSGNCVQEADLQEDQTIGINMYHRNPIDIMSQHGDTVRFSVAQYWEQHGSLTWLMVDYMDSAGDEQCSKTDNLQSGASTSTYTAKCINKVATVAVYGHDDKFSHGIDVPELKSHAVCPSSSVAGKKQKFVFEIPCDPTDQAFCVENMNTARREKAVPGVEPIVLDPEDGSFYCLSDDFPCEGGNGMVHVCHYSTRKGYQTFCIPEPDSEILRFYNHDYCGPCVGGYGGVQLE